MDSDYYQQAFHKEYIIDILVYGQVIRSTFTYLMSLFKAQYVSNLTYTVLSTSSILFVHPSVSARTVPPDDRAAFVWYQLSVTHVQQHTEIANNFV